MEGFPHNQQSCEKRQPDENMAQVVPSVFVSHAASESSVVHCLVESLQLALPGLSFFVSSSYKSMKPGAVWWDEIREQLRHAKVLLACISRQSVNKPWILFECGAGLGCGGVVLPVVLDDLPTSVLAPPLSMFQAIRLDDAHGFVHLVERIAAATATQFGEDRVAQKSFSLLGERPPSVDMSMGVYLGRARIDIAYGWQRYAGDSRTFEVCGGYLSIGHSFDDGFRYPPDDSLSAPWQYFGFRIRRTYDVHMYAVLRHLDGSFGKIYASSVLDSWGFTSDPTDEFRVPLGPLPKGRWHVVIIDMRSLEREFESPVQAIAGFRVRGPLQLSHIWCVEALTQIPSKYRSAGTLISYPR